MKELKYTLFLIVATLYSIATQACMVEEVKTSEEARKIGPLYTAYYKSGEGSKDDFVAQWAVAHNDTRYHMLAAYMEEASPEETSSKNVVGFVDFCVYPSLSLSANIIHIDSLFIDGKMQTNEKEIFDKLFGGVVEAGRQDQVKKIIWDSLKAPEGTEEFQDTRLLSTIMLRQKCQLFEYIIPSKY